MSTHSVFDIAATAGDRAADIGTIVLGVVSVVAVLATAAFGYAAVGKAFGYLWSEAKPIAILWLPAGISVLVLAYIFTTGALWWIGGAAVALWVLGYNSAISHGELG